MEQKMFGEVSREPESVDLRAEDIEGVVMRFKEVSPDELERQLKAGEITDAGEKPGFFKRLFGKK